MNNSALVFLINDDVRAVSVRYEPEGNCSTMKTLDPDLKVDDMVIVETDTRYGFTVAKIKAVDVDVDPDTTLNIKWVVGKLDLTDHQAVLDKEKQAIDMIQSAEKRKRRREMREALFDDADEGVKALELTSIVEDDD